MSIYLFSPLCYIYSLAQDHVVAPVMCCVPPPYTIQYAHTLFIHNIHIYMYMLYRYIYIGELMGYVYKYNSQKVCPCLEVE